MRPSLKDPITELFLSWQDMTEAVDAHLTGAFSDAEALFRRADRAELWSWLYPEWERCHINVVERAPAGDSRSIPKEERDPSRFLGPGAQLALLRRDGFRCRYCGIPVIHADVRKVVQRFYPEAAPWDANDPRKRHMGFQALWLQFDQVVPHSHGGRSDEDNSVVCCALCNFGKDKYTLLQLGLSDPRHREPVEVAWDGLERLRIHESVSRARDFQPPISRKTGRESTTVVKQIHAAIGPFFIPGARISAGYVFTPPLAGKERWFKIGPDVVAREAVRGGISGCLLDCGRDKLITRGLFPEQFKDPGS